MRIIREAAWERRGDHLHFTVTADSFLRHMVRTLVGTMLQATPERLAGSSRAGRASRAGRRRRRGGSISSASSIRRTRARLKPRRARRYDRRVRYRVILFDLDGTLIDSGPIIIASMRHASVTVLGREPDEEPCAPRSAGPG